MRPWEGSGPALVVEDDGVILDAVCDALRSDGFEVVGGTDGVNIAETMAELRLRLAVIDVRLPVGPDRYQVARSLRAVSKMPILFATAADSEDDILAGFAAGGDDYVVKPFSMVELVARVHALPCRTDTADARRLVGDLVLDADPGIVSRAGSVIAHRRAAAGGDPETYASSLQKLRPSQTIPTSNELD